MGKSKIIKPAYRAEAEALFAKINGAADYKVDTDVRAFIKHLITIRGHGAVIMERRMLIYDESYEAEQMFLSSRMLPHSPSFDKPAPQASMPTVSKTDKYIIDVEESKEKYYTRVRSLDYWFKLNDALHNVLYTVYNDNEPLYRLAELYYMAYPGKIDNLLLEISGYLIMHPNCKSAALYRQILKKYPVADGALGSSATNARAALHEHMMRKKITFPYFTQDEIEAILDTETTDDYRPRKNGVSLYDIFEQSAVIDDGRRVNILQISKQLWLLFESFNAHNAKVFLEHPEIKLQTDWRSGPHQRITPINPLSL